MKTGIIFLVAAGALCGCRSFPNIKAGEIHSSTSYLVGSSSFDATGINITAANAKAADVTWKVSLPGFSHITTAKDVVIPQSKLK